MKNSISNMKGVIAVIICCFFSLSVFAKQIPTVTGIMKTTNYGASPVVVGFPTAVNLIQVTPLVNAMDYQVRNKVSLKYDLGTDTFFLNKTTLAVKVKVDRWDISNNPMPQVQKKLTIFIDNKLNRVTLEQAILKLVNGYKVQVEIDSIWLNGISVKTLPKWVSVESEIDLDRYYDFSLPANTSANLTTMGLLDTDCDLITDEIQINWSIPSSVPEEYQLEWVHINNYAALAGTYPASALTADFKNNSTRITTLNNSYKVSLLFDKGFIAFRVRAVGKDWTNPSLTVYGPWSSADVVNIGTLVNNVSRFQVLTEHENLKNWQYAVSYAEEGKKKEVINYFDGSLYNRQTVAKVNSDKNVIVGETIYDFQGRPAVNVLATPVFPNCSTATEPSIKYYPNFNVDSTQQAYSKKDFDLDGGTCLPLVRRMDTTSGASKYYSNGNPDKSNQQAFLPHARRFPFTQIEYTSDNTGRIRSQSDVGREFKLGTGKETRYLYGQPNQLQVDRLFGSETGDAAHYKKNVVIDPNGQSSVTYLNQEGKTIATALAGIPPTEGISGNTKMDSLEYANKNQAKFTIDMFNKDANGKSILNAIPPSNDQINFSSQLLVAFKSLYEFKYELQADTVHDLCLRPNICFNCVYDLEILVKDECGVPLNTVQKVTGKFIPGSPITFATNCSGPSMFSTTESFNLVLDPGVYTVSKTLKINKSAKDFYVKSFADSLYNKCFKTLKQFEAEELAKIDTMDCYTSCASCIAALGPKDDFVSSGQGTALQWDFLAEKCNEPCRRKSLCQVTYEMMLSDVSPGGQYGKFNAATYDASGEQLSVFNPANKLTPNILGGQGNWRYPKIVINNVVYYQYLDENGVRTKVDLIETAPNVFVPSVVNSGLVFTDPVTNTKQTWPENLLNLSDFIPIWDPGYAKSLVLFHPEYAYYVSCSEQGIKWTGDNKSSDYLDSLLEVTETFAQAVTNGFIKSNWNNVGPTPLQKVKDIWLTTSGPYDPFFTNPAFQYATTANQNGNLTTINMTGGSPFNVNLQSEMNNIINTYRLIGSTPYSMADVAASLARCGNNFYATPTAACLRFGLDYSPSFTPAQNDSVRNREWRFFKQFYIAEKQKLQFKRQNFYAKFSSGGLSNWYGGCNSCIGSSFFSPWAAGMIYGFPFNTLPQSSYYDASQPCNGVSNTFYIGKTKRFYDPANTNLNTNVGPVMYQMTGQCPMAFHLQNFLSGMAGGNKLVVNNLFLNTISEFNPDLYLAVWGGINPPPTFINFQWKIVTSSPPILQANIVDPATNTVKCTFKIDITGTGIPNFSSIKAINTLAFDPFGTGPGSFTAVAVYLVGTSTLSANIKGDASCLNINNCNFSENCSPNQFAVDMQALLNFVKSAGQLNSATPYAINLDNVGKQFITSTIKNTLNTVPASNSRIKYQFISPNKYTLFDSTDVSTRIVLTFLTVTPAGSLPSVVTFANIRSNYNNLFKVDGMNGSNVKISDIDGKAERTTLTQTVGISMGDCGLPLPAECQTKEHKVTKDLEKLVKEMLSSKPFNNYNFNIFNLASFSPLLKSYYPASVSTTGSYYTLTGPSPNVDTLRIVFGGSSGCVFKLYHWRNNSTVLNFPNIVNITDFTGIGPQDFAGNYSNFYAIATYSYGTNTYKDTIFGKSCWPIKNCIQCPPPPVSQQSQAQQDSALVASGRGFYDPSIPAYAEYKAAVDSVNINNGWTANDSNFVVRMSFKEFADKGYSNADKYFKFMRNYDSIVDNPSMLKPEQFVHLYGNLENCNKDYNRYVTATAKYNIRAIAVPGSTILPVITDTVFYNNHLCDTSHTYIRYLRDYPAAGPNALGILAYFGITNPNPTYLDSCKNEYGTYVQVHRSFITNTVVQANCKETEIMHPLYSYDQIVKNNLCSSQTGFNMFTGYVNSLANATVVCPPGLPFLEVVPGVIAPEGPLCQKYYISFINTINQYNASGYAVTNGYFLDPNIYPTFYSFQLAGYCNCVLEYINYLNGFINLVQNSTVAPPVDIDNFPGCPHTVPNPAQDSCRKQHTAYTQAISAFNNFVTNNPGSGYALITTQLSFQEYISNYCNCGKKYIANLYAIINGYNPAQEDVKTFLSIDFQCNKPCNNGPPDSAFVFPPYTKYDNPCVKQQINIALQNAANSYQQYLDSVTTYFADKYTRHCLSAFESFEYRYVDKEYHFTLYYYDQAGNLIKTVPPEGVEPINVTSYSDVTEQKIIADRTFNQQNVFTQHRMPTTYIYNSLNQLIFQSLPDHDNMNICDGYNPSGLDTGLIINAVQFVTPNRGYLCGYIRYGATQKRGLVYTSNDGGGTWSKVNGVSSGNLQKVQFVNPSVGFAVSDFGMVFKTIDGGSTWDLLTGLYNPTSGPRYTGLLNNLYFSSTSFGVVGGIRKFGVPFIYYTSDGGQTFTPATVTGSTNGDTLTGFGYDGTTYIASTRNGNKGYLFSSTNGTSWTRINNYLANNLRKVQYINNSVAFAVGEDGTLLKSNPPNTMWSLVPTNQTGRFNDVYFKNVTDGIALIDSIPGKAKLFKTFDGGLTWLQFGDNGDYYSSFQSYDAANNKLIAVGTTGIGVSLAAKIMMNTPPFGITKISISPYSLNNTISYSDMIVNNASGVLFGLAVSNTSFPINNIYGTYNAQAAGPVWFANSSTGLGIPAADASLKKVLVSYSGPATAPNIQALILTNTGKLFAYYKAFTSGPVLAAVAIPGSSPFIADITCNNQNSGTSFYAFDNTNKVMHTVNFAGPTGNLTFVTPHTNASPITGNIKSIEISNSSNEMLMVGDAGYMVYTSAVNLINITWVDVSKSVVPTAFTNVKMVAGTNNFMAIGIDGSVWKNATGGIVDWQLKNSGTAEKLNSFASNPSGGGLVAANNGKLYQLSLANTQAPQLINIPTTVTSHLTDVSIEPFAAAALITSAGGHVLHTPSYLSPAPVVISTFTQGLNGVTYRSNFSNAVVVGNNAFISNYFNTTSNVTKDIYTKGLNSIHFIDVNNGFVIDSNDVIRSTTNGGSSWSVVVPDNNSPNLNKVCATKPGQGVLVGNGKYASVINGTALSAIPISSGVPAGTHFFDIYFNPSKYGVIAGSVTRAMEITPSGPTNFVISYIGQAQGPPKIPNFYAVHVFNDNSFICAGYRGTIYYHKAGTFYQQVNYLLAAGANPVAETFKDIFFYDDYTGYVVGDNGQALKLALTTSIQTAGVVANTLPWQPFCADAVYMSYSSNPQILNLDFRAISYSSKTDGMIGGADNNIVIAGISPNKYSRLLKEQSGLYSSRFWYDKLGRLILSQNTKQFNKKNPVNNLIKQSFSYTLYDNLGRIVEVGEKFENHIAGSPTFTTIFGSFVNSFYNTKVIDDSKLQLWISASGPRIEVTRTYYDNQTILPITYTQRNLRKRVATTTFENLFDGNDLTYQHAIHYDYDIHGNVTSLWQENPQIAVAGQDIKRIDYQFDLISNKVNKVVYSPGEVDQFIHKYSYDADNRITKVETSKDNVSYELDAKYFYYHHGPLARIEFGKDHVQGVDYAYTLQGWVKGVNSNALKKAKDMGRDGDLTFANPNGNFARDVTGYSLNYYKGDYDAIDFLKWNTASTRFEAYTANSDLMNSRNDLFNSNVTAMVTTISKPDTLVNGQVLDPIALPLGNAYRYDQLNRLKRSKSFTNIDTAITNSWLNNNVSLIGLYRNTFAYDANGNIMTQIKRDSLGNIIDSLQYIYETVGPNKKRNRLYHVRDLVNTPSISNDLEDQGTFTQVNINSNYKYDEIGNLVHDESEEIDKIDWMFRGKIKSITRKTGSLKDNIVFDYDAMGNRVSKHVYSSSNVWKYSTFYLRDAQGNVLTVYDKRIVGSNMSYKLDEQHIFGSDRLGMINPSMQMIGAVVNNDSSQLYLGKKYYELANHLDNVLTVITDKKSQIPKIANPTVVDHYAANIVSASDYYPFGCVTPGRSFTSDSYRYAFSGKEKDDEVKGSGNSYDFGMRIYDPRLGRFLSVDPLYASYAWNSTYAYAENTPIWGNDMDGGELKKLVEKAKQVVKEKIGKQNYDEVIKKMDAASAQALIKFSTELYPGVDKLGEKSKQQQFKTNSDNTIAILLYEFATGTGKETRNFNYNVNPVANEFIKGRVLSEIKEKFDAAAKGMTYSEFKEKGIDISLPFSPDGTDLKSSVEKHVKSNLAQIFVGGATVKIRAGEKDGWVVIDVYNETSRSSYILHIAGDYPRTDSGDETTQKALSTIIQHFKASLKIDVKAFKPEPEKKKEEKSSKKKKNG